MFRFSRFVMAFRLNLDVIAAKSMRVGHHSHLRRINHVSVPNRKHRNLLFYKGKYWCSFVMMFSPQASSNLTKNREISVKIGDRAQLPWFLCFYDRDRMSREKCNAISV